MPVYWKINQLFDKPEVFQYSSGFQPIYHPTFKHDVLRGFSQGERLSFRVKGREAVFRFLTHAWSGAVELSGGRHLERANLFSENEEQKAIKVTFADDGPHDISATIVPPDADLSNGQEVWLIGVELSEAQDWLPKSQPISKNCSLTKGTYGTFLTLNRDSVIGASIVGNGAWAAHDLELMKRFVEPGMTVLDVGANIGHHTVAFSSMVGPLGRVIAFEPQTEIFRILSANCVINGCHNVVAYQSCVGETAGAVNLYPVAYDADTNFGALGVDPASIEGGRATGERVRIDRLDTLLGELPTPLSRCDFIKIDVQSFELFVLRGAVDTLRTFRPVLFLEVAPYWMSKFYDYKEIYDFLWDLDYEIDHISDPGVPAGSIKQWSGRSGEEWDILAKPKA